DTSSNKLNSVGGAITMQAFDSITVDSIRSGGGGSQSRLGAPGDISLSASNAIAVQSIYANSNSGTPVRTTLTAPTITLGSTGGIAADVEGTLYLQKPASASAATITIDGTIQGTGSVVIDAGTGGASLNTDANHGGQTRVVSGTLTMNGKSM